MYYRLISAVALFFSIAMTSEAQEGRGQVLPFMAHVVPPVQTVTPNQATTATVAQIPSQPSDQQFYCTQTSYSTSHSASSVSCDCPECSGEQSWWTRFCDDFREKRRDWRKNIWMWSYSHHQDHALQHPKCPPYCEPYWGYHQDCWRKFPPGSYCCPPHLTTQIEIPFSTEYRQVPRDVTPVLAPPPVEAPEDQTPPPSNKGDKNAPADPFKPLPMEQQPEKKRPDYEPVTSVREEIKGTGFYYLAKPEPEWRPSR